MKQENLRNVAIIAHVDHGKTTLVDRLLWASHVFRENQHVEERVLDSNDQERERGITILSKNISISYKGVKINVIDTPGHADFGGEVERVLNMADGALLIVDAYEGPKPQTRFVLSHALERGLRIVVVVNKIDRPNADPEGAVDKVFDLMVELGASDEQLDFPVVYASAVNGYARLDPNDGNMDMVPLLDTILSEIPAPDVDAEGPVALQVCTVDHSSYEGRIGVGRLHSGSLHEKEQVLVVKSDGGTYTARVRKVYTFENLGKVEVPVAHAGDIVAVIGIEDADIGDIITDPANPVEMEPIAEEPTMAVVFEASTSPLVGREGDIVGGRQLKERLCARRRATSPCALTRPRTRRAWKLRAAAFCIFPFSWKPCVARASSSRLAVRRSYIRSTRTATSSSPSRRPPSTCPTITRARPSRSWELPAVLWRIWLPTRLSRI